MALLKRYMIVAVIIMLSVLALRFCFFDVFAVKRFPGILNLAVNLIINLYLYTFCVLVPTAMLILIHDKIRYGSIAIYESIHFRG